VRKGTKSNPEPLSKLNAQNMQAAKDLAEAKAVG